MAVRVSCPSCQAVASVEEQSLGRRGRCRKCGHVFALAPPGRGPGPAGPANLPEAFGRYRILRPLGQGGMGAVYLAHDTKLDRRVALKVPSFHPGDGPQAVGRFEREARAAATLDHPNLCPVHDVGEVDGIHYLTMPYIEGKPLSETIPPGQQVPEAQAAALARKLALALAEAHRGGVVHRDLKPGNIMVNRRREPVVMDFGLARMAGGDDAPITRAGHVLGTALYMAPEQAAGDPAAGPAGDVYSLGVILYELLAGRRPFEGPWSVVIGLKSVMDPEPPSAHRPGLHPDLDAIVLRAIARKPEDRFPTMAALADALEAHLARAADRAQAAFPPGAAPPAPGPESLAAQVFAGLVSQEVTSLREASSPGRPKAAGAEGGPTAPKAPAWTLPAAGAAAALLLGIGLYATADRGRAAIPARDSRVAARVAGRGASGPTPPTPTPRPAPLPPEVPPGAPADARAFRAKRFKVFPEELTWNQARARSEAMGGHLAIIDDAEENRFLLPLLDAAGLQSAWLGATDERAEGAWTWVDGSPMRFRMWAPEQPDNRSLDGQPEHYLVLPRTELGEWRDLPDVPAVGWHPGFVCQWDASDPAPPVAEVASAPPAPPDPPPGPVEPTRAASVPAPTPATSPTPAARTPARTRAPARVAAPNPAVRVSAIRGDWSIVGDELRQSSFAEGAENPYLVFGDPSWSRYDLTFEARKEAGVQAIGLLFHWQGAGDFRSFSLGGYGNRGHDLAFLRGGTWGREAGNHRTGSLELDRWYTVGVEVRGPAYRCYLDGVLMFEQVDDRFDHGLVGLSTWASKGRYRRFQVATPDGRVLFRGLPDPASAPRAF